MKIIIFYTCFLFFSINVFAQQKLQEVNAVLHDESYVAAFGKLPDAATDEQDRIQLNLSYAEQLLRTVDATNLTGIQQANRIIILDLLHEYCTAGIFPTNRDYPNERRPCFIDGDGKICAVGYLAKQTKGRELAEKINAKHQYKFISDMNDCDIETWANEFGLTMQECAMIQPTYGPPPSAQTKYADIKPGYGIFSGLMGGTNIAINVANLSSHYKQNTKLSYIGLVAGTGQIIMGIANVKRTSMLPQINGGDNYTSFKAQNNLSYINIAMGTTIIVTSALNLALQKKIRDKRTCISLYSYPDYSNSVSMGLSFTRKI